ncbi:MAG: hypothetical protein AAF399_17730 [Bacteroidota bacterium]
MARSWKQLKRIEKVILIGFANCLIILGGFWWLDKKPNRDFYVPKGYDGWISIEYQVADAPELSLLDGVQQISINDSGYAYTSSSLEVGWRRDRYFWVEGNDTTQIPKVEEGVEGPEIYLHHHAYFARNHLELLKQLPAGADTILEDNTRLERGIDGRATYTTGDKILEYFYVSKDAQTILFNPPPHPKHEGLESTEDRRVD